MTIRFFVSLFACGLLTLFSGGLLLLTPTDRVMEEATLRPTLTPAATQIPLPERPETLSDVQALLQEADEICELPCFWGIQPGYTPATDVIEFLEPNADFSSARESYAVEYYFREEGEQQPIFSIDVGITDEVASLTEIIVSNPSEWLPAETLELPHVLSIMQSSPQAYLSISLGQRRVFLIIAYDEGVLAQYPFELHIEGDASSPPTGDEPYLFCPSLDQNPFIKLRLSNSDAQSMLEDYAIGFQPGATIQPYWSVDRITGLETEEFIQRIIENPDECIELLSYAELVELGYPF
jgi:hypothetical protein